MGMLFAAALVALGAALVALPGPRRTLREAIEKQWLVLAGGLVDVGGYRLRIECTGSSAPTVILDSGLNTTQDAWDAVKGTLGGSVRVCSYDRAGLGRSEAGPKPRTSQQIVDELHRLLINGRVPGPYVLVGHSFGGLNVRLYASEHPEQVAGLVLVEPAHEDQYLRFAALMLPASAEEYLRHEGGGNYEGVDLLKSAEQVRAAPPPPPVPSVVISGDLRRETGEGAAVAQRRLAIQELHPDLVRRLPNARHVIAEGSGHLVPHDRPDVISSAVQTVVQASRGQQVPQGAR
jgi:pimeloyl-ACP methyl ester carboxylesterase